MKISKSKIDTQKSGDKYAECTTKIQEAIDCLCKVAGDDIVAKESIANLGVVLLDLKSK